MAFKSFARVTCRKMNSVAKLLEISFTLRPCEGELDIKVFGSDSQGIRITQSVSEGLGKHTNEYFNKKWYQRQA
jgi:hypothetical protein